MPDATTEPVAQTEDKGMEGFEQAFQTIPGAGVGQTEAPKAVETSAEPATPEPAKDKAETPPEPAPDKPEPAKPVNFDGFSDAHKKVWERLLKDGHATPDECEVARQDALRQNYFSRRTAEVARKEEALEAERSKMKEDLAVLETIRAKPALLDLFGKVSRGEVDERPADDLVSRKEADELLERKLAQREAEAKQRTTTQQKQYDAKRSELKAAIDETMKILSVTPKVMQTYLEAEEGELPEGADPILSLDPHTLRKLLTARHREAVAEAKAKAAEEQLSQRTSKDVRTAKQSLPPARREVTPAAQTPGDKTTADLGLDPEWSGVQGWGFQQK